MKKFICFIILFCIHIYVHAPQLYTLPKITDALEDKLKILFHAFAYVESTHRNFAYNNAENAAGILQIRPIMIDEVNRIQDSIQFELYDRWDIDRSFKIFCIIMKKYNPKLNVAKACQIWNGKKTTLKYINKIKYAYERII